MSARVDIIRAWATRLADLQPRTAHPDDASLLGIMAGAPYSLEKADHSAIRMRAVLRLTSTS